MARSRLNLPPPRGHFPTNRVRFTQGLINLYLKLFHYSPARDAVSIIAVKISCTYNVGVVHACNQLLRKQRRHRPQIFVRPVLSDLSQKIGAVGSPVLV
jgi:hypothetical protein